ncbi:imidazolonepropionase [Sphingobium sp. YR768]|uniref:imidazolonepropionase n=1 Tax=Sphingobium sp. YR768 TaxID=1884365 RepID=UPI0008BC5CC8|nr:imidazolonepropionase [Sphingobium sp. YR768]SER99634.1 imidazolonepropionase [Sphingobium sp. YR768]
MICDRIWRNATLMTMADGLGLVPRGMVAARDGRIVYAGAEADAPAFESDEIVDCEGRFISPGLIDCHTHIVHAGDRANEFAMRLRGATYEEIARAGGGIVSTMKATRAASETALLASAQRRVAALVAEGVTTIEVKSGYGLTLDDEMKMLRVARALGPAADVTVRTTLLAAHAVPPEYAGRSDAYVDLVCGAMIPAAAQAGLADAVDAFCEGIAFSPEQVERVFAAARAHDLPVKLHAEQLSALSGSALAARHGALSADHLEHATRADIAAMAQAGTVATLLPGAYYFMRETHRPPVEWLREVGVPIAIATDCNPGTSPLTSILLAANMGATLFGLTVEECLRGVTVHAARAIGLSGEVGMLAAGHACDLAIWDIGDPAELVCRIGFNPLYKRVRHGR